MSSQPQTRSPSEAPYREPPTHAHSSRRARPRLTEQIQIIRELWLLREQARVQAAERCFLAELERLLSGRPHSADLSTSVPPPPPPYEVQVDPVVYTPPPPAPPPLPPSYAPSSPPATLSAVTVLDDGMVFESNPPPRSAGSPARERPSNFSMEMEATRSRQRVTNITAEFRARLEGQVEPEMRTLPRSRSFGELVGQRNVSSVLDSAFRHRLESVLTRREVSAARHLRDMYTGERDGGLVGGGAGIRGIRGGRGGGRGLDAGRGPTGTASEGGTGSADEFELERLVRGEDPGVLRHRGDVATLETVVAALREEVSVLRNVVGASFDLQLDIQRSIRQEVAAAMSAPARVSIEAGADGSGSNSSSSTVTTTANTLVNSADASNGGAAVSNNSESSTMSDVSGAGTGGAQHGGGGQMVADSSLDAMTGTLGGGGGGRVDVVRAGRCSICMEKSVDAMLYACGHMCTCSLCGRQLLATGQSCPICRAPVRDVVRVFVVSTE